MVKLYHSEKTFSVYKPYTEWVNKAKAGYHLSWSQSGCMEDSKRFILNHKIMYNQTDEKIAVSF